MIEKYAAIISALSAFISTSVVIWISCPLDENDWTHQYEWFATHLELFNQVFRPRIAALNAEDWIPENTDE